MRCNKPQPVITNRRKLMVASYTTATAAPAERNPRSMIRRGPSTTQYGASCGYEMLRLCKHEWITNAVQQPLYHPDTHNNSTHATAYCVMPALYDLLYVRCHSHAVSLGITFAHGLSRWVHLVRADWVSSCYSWAVTKDGRSRGPLLPTYWYSSEA